MPDSPEFQQKLRDAAARGDAKRVTRSAASTRAPASEPVARTAAVVPTTAPTATSSGSASFGQKQTVVVWMALAFLVYTIGRSPTNVELPPSQQLTAWAFLTITLAILVDMNETAEIGKTLTVLLLVSILLMYGEGLITWVNRKVGAPLSTPANAHVGGK